MSPARRPGDRRPSYESYKDSGVQWLGSIPTHWTTSRLRATDRATPGQACRPYHTGGHRWPRPNRSDEGHWDLKRLWHLTPSDRRIMYADVPGDRVRACQVGASWRGPRLRNPRQYRGSCNGSRRTRSRKSHPGCRARSLHPSSPWALAPLCAEVFICLCSARRRSTRGDHSGHQHPRLETCISPDTTKAGARRYRSVSGYQDRSD